MVQYSKLFTRESKHADRLIKKKKETFLDLYGKKKEGGYF